MPLTLSGQGSQTRKPMILQKPPSEKPQFRKDEQKGKPLALCIPG